MDNKSELKLTWVDRAIGLVSPEAGLARAVNRHKVQMFNENVAFRGADRSLLPSKFRRGGKDANSSLQGSLQTLRNRSRDLNRNNAMAVSARETQITDVIGSGLKLDAMIDNDFLKMSREEGQKWQEDVQRRFNNWASSELSDLERSCNFYEKQAVIFGAVWDSGDCFVNLPVVNSELLNSRVRVEVIEADRVNSGGRFQKTDNKRMFEGVKLGANGAPISYSVEFDSIVNGIQQSDWKEVLPYDRVTNSRKFLHIYEQVRPGQTRGYPRLTSVLTKLKELDEYMDAEIRAAVVAGLYTVFVTTNYGDIPGVDQPVEDVENGATIDLGYGSLVGLAPGEDISTATPGRPNPNVGSFVEAIQADIAAGLSMPYEVLVKRFNSSYSASRAALLEFDKAVQRRRTWFSDRVCKPIYRRWMDDMVLTGKIKAPGYFDDPDLREAWLGSQWIGPTFAEIDPVKPAQAALLWNKLGVVTLDRLTRQQTGSDFDKTHKQLVHEMEKRLEDGIIELLEATSGEADVKSDEVVEPAPKKVEKAEAKDKSPAGTKNHAGLEDDEVIRLMNLLEDDD